MGYELSLLLGATGLVLAVALVQVAVLVRLTRTAADITRMHDRLTRMVAALDLLTDTAETGFRQFAEHLDQRATAAPALAAPARRPEAPAQARRTAAQGHVSQAPAAPATPAKALRKASAPSAPPSVASTRRPASGDAPVRPGLQAPPALMVATRKASRTASARRATATVAAFREAN